jgi:hypothetical protein
MLSGARRSARYRLARLLSIFISPMCAPTKQRERKDRTETRSKHILLSGESGPLEVLGEAASHIATDLVTKDGRFSDDEVTG